MVSRLTIIGISVFFLYFLEEIVNIHALVNIKEECDFLVNGERQNFNFFQFSNGIDIFFILRRFKSSLNINSASILVLFFLI